MSLTGKVGACRSKGEPHPGTSAKMPMVFPGMSRFMPMRSTSRRNLTFSEARLAGNAPCLSKCTDLPSRRTRRRPSLSSPPASRHRRPNALFGRDLHLRLAAARRAKATASRLNAWLDSRLALSWDHLPRPRRSVSEASTEAREDQCWFWAYRVSMAC